jgi:hypothetical protein
MQNFHLKSITELAPEQYSSYMRTYGDLRKRFKNEYDAFDPAQIWEGHKKDHMYGKAIYTGKIKEGVKITPLELSMACVRGFNHFGGEVTITDHNYFTVVVFTD